jgi:hypothetical protein
MMYPTRPHLNLRFAASKNDDVEELLRRFYRSEMVHPWPDAPAVTPLVTEAPRPRRLALGRFFRSPARLAIAASVALLVIGYLALQTWFPDPKPGSEVDKTNIGNKLQIHQHDPFRKPGVLKPDAKKAQDQGPVNLPVYNLPAKK